MQRQIFAVGSILVATAAVLFAGPQDEEHEHSELEEHMELIEGTIKSLRRSLRDPANRAQSLTLMTDLQAATVASKGLIPEMTESVPEGEREKFVSDYRVMMVDFLGHQVELERAILAADEEAAQAAFKLVRDMEDLGHERFTADEE